MSTLKKGDYAFTEYGISKLREPVGNDWIVDPIEPLKGVDHHFTSIPVKELTRAKVEAYLKGKGYAWVAKDIIRKHGDIYCSIIEQGGKYFVSSVFGEEHFDTAQEQLAEAIFVARLLNATK